MRIELHVLRSGTAAKRPAHSIAAVTLGATLVLTCVVPSALAYTRPGGTERVSVASEGTGGNDITGSNHAISADGRYVAFESWASNLVEGDANNAFDVFVHDRRTRATELVSIASDGTRGDSSSAQPDISADGRYVAFEGEASNLVPGDTNTCPTPLGTIPSCSDIFVHDRETGTTERVSVSSDGAQGINNSWQPDISDDGRYVAFGSAGGNSNLVPGDTNEEPDVFVHDRETGATERVSVSSDGTEGNGDSLVPSISADGRYVAFQSASDNLVPGDTNQSADIFVHDMETGATERVSVASDGTEGGSPSGAPAISSDGRYVAFGSDVSSLVPGDTNQSQDVFVHDMETGATERVSLAHDGTEGNAGARLRSAISLDGQFVAFGSDASNLVTGDINGERDVFVRDRGDSPGVVGTLSVLKVSGGEGVGVSGQATFSGATVAGATDPDDGTGIGPLEATDVGAELTGAALIYRPEQEDLLLRLDLSSLPPTAGGLPAVLYGLEFSFGGITYEVRALRMGAIAVPPAAPHAALYRCTPDCTEHARLTGSFGSTGEHVLVSVPLSALGAAEGTELTDVRAFTALGEATPGALLPLDEVALSSSVIPASRVELGIAPASALEHAVAFDTVSPHTDGNFSATVSTDGFSSGSHRVWARACLGDACGAAAFGQVTL